MQILLGSHETLIKLKKKREQVFHIEDYIEKHFLKKTVEESSILLLYNEEEHYNRLFLLKWLYSIYKNGVNHTFPDFKSILIQRIEKPIRIVFQAKKEHSINLNLSIENEQSMRLDLDPFSFSVYYTVKRYLLASLENVECTNLSFLLQRYDPSVKEILSNIINSEFLLTYKLNCTFSHETLNSWCTFKTENLHNDRYEDPLSQAYFLLKVDKHEPIHDIKAKYKSLVKLYHPDKIYYEKNEKIDEYTKKFQSIQNAYHLIRSSYKNYN